MESSNPPTNTNGDMHMRTKIVATLGPASMDQNVMKEMVQLGVRVFRLNFSHADAEYFGPVIQKIRQVEKDTRHPPYGHG